MTRQEAFDAAAAHLLATGVPSHEPDNYNSCLYSGTGCALRPFAPTDPAELAAWDRGGAISDLPLDWLPDFIRGDIAFFDLLQAAHDQAAQSSSGSIQKWRRLWLVRMHEIASRYSLSPAILEKEFAQ
jgi:hypothetical protein